MNQIDSWKMYSHQKFCGVKTQVVAKWCLFVSEEYI